MVNRIKQTSNTEILDDYIAYFDSYNQLAQREAQRIFGQIEEPFLDELRFYPPPPPNSKYKRTFKLRDGWYVRYYSTSDGFTVEAGNDVSYAQWVVGSLAQARDAAARFQQAFHADNGWPLATDTTTYWLNVFNEEMAAWHRESMDSIGSSSSRRRATTRIRR